MSWVLRAKELYAEGASIQEIKVTVHKAYQHILDALEREGVFDRQALIKDYLGGAEHRELAVKYGVGKSAQDAITQDYQGPEYLSERIRGAYHTHKRSVPRICQQMGCDEETVFAALGEEARTVEALESLCRGKGWRVNRAAKHLGWDPRVAEEALLERGFLDPERVAALYDEGYAAGEIARKVRHTAGWVRSVLGERLSEGKEGRCGVCGILVERSDIDDGHGRVVHPAAWVRGERDSVVCWMCWEELERLSAL